MSQRKAGDFSLKYKVADSLMRDSLKTEVAMKIDGQNVEHSDVGDYVLALRNEMYIYAKLKYPDITKEQVNYVIDWYEEILSQLDDDVMNGINGITDILGGLT